MIAKRYIAASCVVHLLLCAVFSNPVDVTRIDSGREFGGGKDHAAQTFSSRVHRANMTKVKAHDTTRGRNTAVLICAVFGEEQPHMPFFLKSINQSGMDVLLFGDAIPAHKLPDNVMRVPMSWGGLLMRVQHVLPECFVGAAKEWWKDFKSVRKLIDFKPLFANILEQELRGYGLWGYGDTDVLYGNISKFLTSDVLSSFDVIPLHHDSSDHKVWGAATFFRNEPKLNTLFRRAPDLCETMRDPTPWGFDEWYGKGKSNSMDSIIKRALGDPRMALRVYSWPHPHNFWDAYDRFVWPTNVSVTCELRCDGHNSCRTVRQCKHVQHVKCTRVEVALCHFQRSKRVLQRKLADMTSAQRARLLASGTIFVNSDQGFHVPSPADDEAALQRGLSAHGHEADFQWGRSWSDIINDKAPIAKLQHPSDTQEVRVKFR
eukprot:3204246-Rhodomonas_salina.1